MPYRKVHFAAARAPYIINPLNDTAGLLICLCMAYAYALAIGAAMVRFPRLAGGLGTLGFAALLFPFAIVADSVLFRALAEALCLDLALKTTDYGRQVQSSPEHRSFTEFCYLAMPFPIFLAVIEGKQRLPLYDVSPLNLLRIVAGAGGVALALGATLWLNEQTIVRDSFLIDHLLKVPAFILAVEAGSRMILGLERLAGFHTTPLVRNVFLSITVAEFWLRWNHRVHRWLFANIFRPAARKWGRMGGLLMVFLISGLVHELAFDIATSHWDGYQITFFALQAPLVIVSDYAARVLRRNRWVQVPMYLLTVLWMTATSMLFLRGVDRVFGFMYASEPWLP
jgi:hypothetical protein